MIWKEIKDYPNFWVSDTGLVRRNDYTFIQRVNSKGYLRVCTTVSCETIRLFVHREVAKAFIPNPENRPQVNHKDGDKTNNHVDNLEWVTNKENRAHAVANGLHKIPKGEETGSHKLTEQDVLNIRRDYRFGSRKVGAPSLGKQYGVSVQTILDIVHHRKWKHVQ